MSDQERIFALEAEVKRLNIKLETLVTFLNVSKFGRPPQGRASYGTMVKKALEDQGLQRAN